MITSPFLSIAYYTDLNLYLLEFVSEYIVDYRGISKNKIGFTSMKLDLKLMSLYLA